MVELALPSRVDVNCQNPNQEAHVAGIRAGCERVDGLLSEFVEKLGDALQWGIAQIKSYF